MSTPIALHRILALLGPISFAAANFVVLLFLQQTSSSHSFGLYGFMQVTIATGMGLTNGIVGTPLTLAVGRNDTDRSEVVGSFSLSFLALLPVGLLVAPLAGSAAGATPLEATLQVAAAATMWLRWFTRSLAVSLHRQPSAALSDGIYALSSIGLSAITLISQTLSVASALGIQAAACLLSLTPMASTLAISALSIRRASIGRFQQEFARSGIWSTLMVVASEVVATVHAYSIALFFGAAAYAPVALATLLFRPQGVVLTGSVIFELPRMVQRVRTFSTSALSREVRRMQSFLTVSFAANLVVAVLLTQHLDAIAPTTHYSHSGVIVAISLTSISVLLRSVREPMIIGLQAMQEIRHAAKLSLVGASTAAVVAAATLSIASNEPTWSLLGAVSGELVSLTLVGLLLKRRQS